MTDVFYFSTIAVRSKSRSFISVYAKTIVFWQRTTHLTQETYAQLLQGKAQQELSDSRTTHASLQQQPISTATTATTATAAASTVVNASASTNSNSNSDATAGKKRPVASATGGGNGGAEGPPVLPPALRDAPLQVEQLR